MSKTRTLVGLARATRMRSWLRLVWGGVENLMKKEASSVVKRSCTSGLSITHSKWSLTRKLTGRSSAMMTQLARTDARTSGDSLVLSVRRSGRVILEM